MDKQGYRAGNRCVAVVIFDGDGGGAFGVIKHVFSIATFIEDTEHLPRHPFNNNSHQNS